MNQLLQWLSGGDLRSDGMANEVAALVLDNPEAFDDLFDGVTVIDDLIRGRAADALEKVARRRPDLLIGRLDELVAVAEIDHVPVVLMHLAMILGHLAMYEERLDEILGALAGLLRRDGVFVRSWAIVSLCIAGKLYTSRLGDVVDLIVPLRSDASAAIRTRARKAIHLLTQPGAAFPKGWVKSEHLKFLEKPIAQA